jgi:signal transduction histidine kinase
MFARTRLRLTILYAVLFAFVLGLFSLVFYVGIATVLAPTFDVSPDLTNEQAAEVAYQATIDQIRLVLVVADMAAIVLVGGVAWILATRTLAPLHEAHARQRAFAADASHEMRTPLAAIRASAEGALVGPATTDELRAALAVVAESAERLGRLTTDLLLLARADARAPDRDRLRIDLSVAVAECLETFGRAHPDLPLPRLTLAEDLPVVADGDEIGRIVENIVDNAYRYGPPGAAPRVTTRRADRAAIVEVADDGPGIREADLERVFEPFARLRADAAAAAGSGLGLAIARSLAARNRGQLTVSSRPGQGSTFRLSLPLVG